MKSRDNISEEASGAPADLLVAVGLIAVELPADGPQLRHVRLDERTVLVGYDPRNLNEHLVGLWLDTQFPAGYELAVGVPA